MKIIIDGFKLRAHHGVMEQERAVGQDFEVSLWFNLKEYDGSDCIEATVNYAEVVGVIEAVMAEPSALIEHAVTRIALALRQQFPAIGEGQVRLRKLCPPLGKELSVAAETYI